MPANHKAVCLTFSFNPCKATLYAIFKTLYIIGVVVLLGNVTITAYWKVLADRTSDARLIAHAQHGVTVADWILTLVD